MNKRIGNVTLNYDLYSGEDLYSDGPVEDELLDIVKTIPKEEYGSVINEKKSWPILYHLSYYRENIISWLPIGKDESVLEVGSGCGALTGILSEMAKDVTCIELSEKRSLINAYRNKDKDNIEIIIGNFQDIEKTLDKKYDYITLIGVLEYGALYIDSDNPHVEFLKCLKQHLKPNGKVVIAIENKLGMKYWAGCKEDHLGVEFIGIEGYPCESKVRTFSKHELTEIVRKAGYANAEFYYPYPDYKFPTTIYSDKYLPRISELINNYRNFDSGRIMLFDESKAYETILKEELYDKFANSFLVIVKK